MSFICSVLDKKDQSNSDKKLSHQSSRHRQKVCLCRMWRGGSLQRHIEPWRIDSLNRLLALQEAMADAYGLSTFPDPTARLRPKYPPGIHGTPCNMEIFRFFSSALFAGPLEWSIAVSQWVWWSCLRILVDLDFFFQSIF